VMRACMAARAKLAKTNGSIVNIASMLSFFGGPRAPAYSASKGGIAQLTRSLAVAWAADGIRVNAVAPGWIATPLTRALQNDAVRSDQLLARTPLGRWGDAREVAGPVLFLSSEAASFMTGAIVTVDGGYSAA
jgi:NAD(P)-dependent dehydrogenase (short-subunit alcohol dehydrogenase family)